MSGDVTVAVLLAALVHAAWNALIKRGRDPLFETTLAHSWVSLPAAIAVVMLPAPGVDMLLLVLASAVVHVGYYHALAGAYRSGDLSLAYPLMRGSAPMLTAVLAIPLLGEWPSPAGWSGIVAICAGVLVVGLASAPGAHASTRGRSIGWALLAAATIVMYTLVDSIGARTAPNAWTYVAWLALLEGPLVFGAVWLVHRGALLDYARRRGAQPMAIGVASMLAYAIALWAMTRAPVAMVAALRETSVLFALLIARLLLGERVGRIRWTGAAMIAGGVAALRLA